MLRFQTEQNIIKKIIKIGKNNSDCFDEKVYFFLWFCVVVCILKWGTSKYFNSYEFRRSQIFDCAWYSCTSTYVPHASCNNKFVQHNAYRVTRVNMYDIYRSLVGEFRDVTKNQATNTFTRDLILFVSHFFIFSPTFLCQSSFLPFWHRTELLVLNWKKKKKYNGNVTVIYALALSSRWIVNV